MGKTPECVTWLNDNSLEILKITNAIVQDAMDIKHLIGVINDKYHPNGVGENDIFIIATAMAYNSELISDEKRQNALPKEPTKRKIPAVCSMQEVAVPCTNFLEFIKRSGEIFR
jgi:C1A family cysteine protease